MNLVYAVFLSGSLDERHESMPSRLLFALRRLSSMSLVIWLHLAARSLPGRGGFFLPKNRRSRPGICDAGLPIKKATKNKSSEAAYKECKCVQANALKL